MSIDINLLRAKDENVLRKEKQVRIVWIASWIFLAIAGLSSAVSFLLAQSFSQSPARKESENLIRNISAATHTKEKKLLLVKDRLAGISSILKTRTSYGKSINTFIGKFPQDVLIENLDLDKKTLQITVSSPTLLSLNTLIDDLTDMAKQKELIRSLSLESITGGQKNSKYLVTLKADL